MYNGDRGSYCLFSRTTHHVSGDTMRRRIPLSALLLLASSPLAMAQSPMPAGPSAPPPIIQRFREMVKVGHADAHEANERAWAGAYAKTKLPYYSIAMTSMTGP